MSATRTAEGWIIIHTERRNDDPWKLDDCWHRGAYTVATVLGTNICIECNDHDGIGTFWDKIENAVRAAGLAGVAELTGHSVKGLGYRRIITIETQEQVDARIAQAAIDNERYAQEYAGMTHGGNESWD